MLVEVGRSAVLGRLGEMGRHLRLRKMHDGLGEMRHGVEHVPRQRVLQDGDLRGDERRRRRLHRRRSLLRDRRRRGRRRGLLGR